MAEISKPYGFKMLQIGRAITRAEIARGVRGQMLASGADAPAGLSSAGERPLAYTPHPPTPRFFLDDSAGETELAWDIRPDCTYWLSLKGSQSEFKRDGESDDAAVKQVAAAASLALYNRYYLHTAAVPSQPDLSRDQKTISLTISHLTMTHWSATIVPLINEIHRWGLSKHGPSCERAIKAVLQVDVHERLG
ncbi:hypothetical protein NKR23_g12407 [Pleurostoma richardsiae]|uniref:Uncharacterized protein n=1 Tax=Pleurostoma richardsiae TaxID=41990 RepID=A0AA38R246_9PEZI|nr:hypothetical protein NKR23_g12407 [Pleurostoma richardsiae]